MYQLIKSVTLPAILSQMLMFAGLGYSQPCVEAELLKLPGEWKAGMKSSTANVSKESLVMETQTVQSIFDIFKSGYNPMGCQVSYGSIFGFNSASGKNWMANPYGLSMYFLDYVCVPDNSGKHSVNISTPTSLDVRVNKFQMERCELFAAELPDDSNPDYITINRLPEYKDGFWYLVTPSDYHKDIKTYTWIICYDGKLPFKHVTQREYLNLKKAEFESELAETNKREQSRRDRGDEFTEDDIDFYNRQREYFGKPIH